MKAETFSYFLIHFTVRTYFKIRLLKKPDTISLRKCVHKVGGTKERITVMALLFSFIKYSQQKHYITYMSIYYSTFRVFKDKQQTKRSYTMRLAIFKTVIICN